MYIFSILRYSSVMQVLKELKHFIQFMKIKVILKVLKYLYFPGLVNCSKLIMLLNKKKGSSTSSTASELFPLD